MSANQEKLALVTDKLTNKQQPLEKKIDKDDVAIEIELINEFRKRCYTKIAQDCNYDLNYIKLSDFDIKSLNETCGKLKPLLIQDDYGALWLYGLDDQKTSKLTKLSSSFSIKLNFSKHINHISSDELLHLNKDLYIEINKHKAHFQSLHFSHFPNNIMEDEELFDLAQKKMQEFISSESFVKVFRDLLKIINDFKQVDVDNLAGPNETENGKALTLALKTLTDNGFYSTRGEVLNFWSGNTAQFKADSILTELACSKVPSMLIIFDFMAYLKYVKKRQINEIITEALSKIFALDAKGNVNVYLSANKASENACIIVGNNFWNTELLVLQQLRHAGKVENIFFHLYDESTQTWSMPININSHEGGTLCMTRRQAYQPDISAFNKILTSNYFQQFEAITELNGKANKFRNGIQAFGDQSLWMEKSGPRPTLTVGKARELLEHWKMKKNKSIVEKSKTTTKSNSNSNTESKILNEKRSKAIMALTLHHWLNLEKRSVLLAPPPLLMSTSGSTGGISSASASSSAASTPMSRAGEKVGSNAGMKLGSNSGPVVSSSMPKVIENLQKPKEYNGIPSVFFDELCPKSPTANKNNSGSLS